MFGQHAAQPCNVPRVDGLDDGIGDVGRIAH
jgi:hypothetical protein